MRRLILFLLAPALAATATSLETVVQRGHRPGSEVKSAVFSQDGRFVLSGGNDGRAVLWEVASGMEVRSFGGGASVHAVALSADGTRAFIGTKDGVLSAWDLASGARLNSVALAPPLSRFANDTLLTGPISAIAIDPGGRRIACALSDSHVAILDATTLEVQRKVRVAEFNAKRDEEVQVSGVAFRPDGETIAAAGLDGQVHFIDARSGEARRVLKLEQPANKVAFSSNGKLLAVAAGDDLDVESREYSPYILDGSTGAHLARVPRGRSAAWAIAFSPGGRLLAFGTYRGGVSLYDLEARKALPTIATDARSVELVLFSPDGKYLLVGNGNVVELWEVASRKMARQLISRAVPVSDLDVSPDGRYLATGSFSVRLWDLATARMVRIPQPKNNFFTKVRFTADSRRLVTFNQGTGIGLWDVATATEAVRLPKFEFGSSSVGVDAAGTRVAFRGEDTGLVRLHDLVSGKVLRTFAGLKVGWLVDVSPAGDLVAAVGEVVPAARRDSMVKVWDSATGAERLTHDIPSFLRLNSMRFSPDGRSLVLGHDSHKIWILHLTKPEVSGHQSHTDAVFRAVFTPDSKAVATASWDGTARLFDAASGAPLREFKGHTGPLSDVAVTQDGRHLVTAADDATVRVWNLATGEVLVSLVSVGDSDYVAFTPDGRYVASRGAMTAVRFSRGLQSYPFENFDLRLNRPDVVVERLGRAGPQLVKSYRHAWEKRLRKMRFTEGQLGEGLHLPEVSLETKSLPFATKEKTLELKIRAKDDLHVIDRINVYVNDVPVHGSRGISVIRDADKSLKRKLSVELVPGRNKVQVSVHDVLGVESLKETFEITYEGPAPQPELYILAVGVSAHRDARFDLRYAAKDAGDVAAALRGAKGFAKVHERVIIDTEATRPRIGQARKFLEAARVDDHVVVFFAGHGLLDEKLDYYLATHDLDFAAPAGAGLPYDELEGLLDGIAARRKLLLVDACHSGEVDKETTTLVDGAVAAAGGTVKSRGFKMVGPPRAGGMEGSLALLQELFADLRRGSGALVVSSASGTELAFESAAFKNGVFTYALLDGLKSGAADKNRDGRVDVSELRDYLVARVQDLSAGRQRPTARRESIEFDFAVY